MEGSSEDEKLNFINQDTERISRQGSAQSKQKEKSIKEDKPTGDQTSIMQKTF